MSYDAEKVLWWNSRGYKRFPTDMFKPSAVCLWQRKFYEEHFLNVYEYAPLEPGYSFVHYEADFDVEVGRNLTMRCTAFTLSLKNLESDLLHVEQLCQRIWNEIERVTD